MAASSHPSRREQETEGEATSRSRAGRCRRADNHTVGTTMVHTTPVAQRKRWVTTAVTPLPVMATEAT
jgi:hypothetical protein